MAFCAVSLGLPLLCGFVMDTNPDERHLTTSSTFTSAIEIYDTQRKEPADPSKPENREESDDWTEVRSRKRKRKKQAGASSLRSSSAFSVHYCLHEVGA